MFKIQLGPNKDGKEGEKWTVLYERASCSGCFVFHVLELPLTIPGSDGTDPPKKRQLVARL